MVVGQKIAPILSQLLESVPNLLGAQVCTLDGMNVCSLGFDEQQVAKMAALSSSLLSISGCAMDNIPLPETDRNRGGMLDLLVLKRGQTDLIAVTVPNATSISYLLFVAADDVQIGLLVVNAKQVAKEIGATL